MPLEAKLKKLDEFAHKGHYISRSNIDELLYAVNVERPTPAQYWQCLTYFGNITSI